MFELRIQLRAPGSEARATASDRQAATGPWRREHFRRLGRRHEPSANHFGYSLLDLARPDPFPVDSAHTA